MNIKIYQINDESGGDKLFKSLSGLGIKEIDASIYEKVFEGDVDCRNLEDVYTMFNLYHPESYKGRSLSVSDVIVVTEDSGNIFGKIKYYTTSTLYEECIYETKETFWAAVNEANEVGRTIDTEICSEPKPIVAKGAYFCDSIGFEKISFDENKTIKI